MIKLLASALLAVSLALAGCNNPAAPGPTYPVVGQVDQVKMEQAAFAARSAYGGVLRLMAEYVSLPRCQASELRLCSSQTAVDTMRRYEIAADTATAGAATLARSPTKTPVALANAVADAQRAVEIFRNTVAAYNPPTAAVVSN